MSGNSGTAGGFDPDLYARELEETRRVLDTPTLGAGRDAELAELRRLLDRYPDEARPILDENP
ncbi:MAG: hypothetical protein JWR24_5124 [Actinoallomurus sp.]|nr:hypothetical protein [Actinoallomurus sp.]